MSALTVLHVVTSLDPGGMENGVCNIANGLATRGIRSHVACLERPGAFAARLSSPENVHVLGKRGGFSLRAVFRLAKAIRGTSAALLHTHNLGPLIYASLATLGGRTCRIIHGEHALLAPWELQPRRIRQRTRLYRHCRAIHTVSDGQIEELLRLGLRHSCLVAIANGVDTGHFCPGDSAAEKARLKLPAGSVTIGLVGRFGPFKRHDALIGAFAEIAPRFPLAHLVFIGGGGSEESRIRELAAPHPRIHFTGFQQDPAPFYRALDLLVIPSINEGMSNAALEAMACGVPVLGNLGCGHEQIISNGGDGILADLSSPGRVAAELTKLLETRARLVDMGSAARMTATAKFSLTAMLDRYEQLYRAHARA